MFSYFFTAILNNVPCWAHHVVTAVSYLLFRHDSGIDHLNNSTTEYKHISFLNLHSVVVLFVIFYVGIDLSEIKQDRQDM